METSRRSFVGFMATAFASAIPMRPPAKQKAPLEPDHSYSTKNPPITDKEARARAQRITEHLEKMSDAELDEFGKIALSTRTHITTLNRQVFTTVNRLRKSEFTTAN